MNIILKLFPYMPMYLAFWVCMFYELFNYHCGRCQHYQQCPLKGGKVPRT